MLLTICPNCSAQFKVQPEQLNVRQGRVMCGRCRQVFNAFQSLSRAKDDLEMQVTAPMETAAARPSDHKAPAPFSAADAQIEPIADRLFMREEPVSLPAAFSATEPLPQVSREFTAMHGIFDGKSTVRSQPDGTNEKEAPANLLPDREDKPGGPGIDLSYEDNPLLVEAPTNRVAPVVATSGVWRVGAFLLLVGLLGQAAYAFRSTLVSNYPQLRPTVSDLCELVGCSLSWGRDETALKFEATELIESPGKPGQILLTAILVNRGKTKQDLPSLELRLTDNANQVVVSRLLQPGDYLGRAIAKNEGLAPNTELYINVDLKLESNNKTSASGYGLLVFYP